MSTKYILHGGTMSVRSDSNRAFYQEMSAGIEKSKILLIYFARLHSEYDYLLNRDRDNFTWASPEKVFEFTVAELNTLEEQIKDCDVILIAGGDTDKLFTAIQESGVDLHEACKGKVVTGSSAGAYLISAWYYTNSGKEIRQGLALAPVAAWAHYRADRGSEYYLEDEDIAQIEQELISKVGDGKLVLLPEQQFRVL